MSLLIHLPRHRPLVGQQCIPKNRHVLDPARSNRFLKTSAAGPNSDLEARAAEWDKQARNIRAGAQKSMLAVLEERGFVKDIAG